MAARAVRLEARLTPTQRKQIEQAAALAGESVSSFVVLAALDRADVLVTERASTVVPAAYFVVRLSTAIYVFTGGLGVNA
jgi:uncharacterized protein (DUF1778 family)